MKSPRIILADDHTLALDALKTILEPEFKVVGLFDDGLSLLNRAQALSPDVIVLDVHMPLLNGLNVGLRLKSSMPRVKLIYLAMSQNADLAAEAFRLGASAYLLKKCTASELVTAIRLALRGSCYLTPMLAKRTGGLAIHNLKQCKMQLNLTLRQKEVLQLLAEGRSMKEAAFMLKVSPRTVAFHKYTMMQRLHLSNSAQLIEYAVRNSPAPAWARAG